MNTTQSVSAVFTATTPSGVPTLPLVWVDNNEATDGLVYTPPAYELNLATQTWVTGPPTGCTGFSSHFPYWTVGSPTTTGLQQAITDDEACRTAHSGTVCTILDIPTALFSSSTGLLIPQSSPSPASCFIILRSTLDSNLPNGRTVGTHGVQDDLSNAGITDIGIPNPTGDGKNMYYALGAQSLAPADGGTGTGTSCVTAAMSGTVATFTLIAGTGCNATYPATFTVGNVLQASSFAPSGYNTYWTILSGGSGGTTLTAQSCTYAATPVCVTSLASSTSSGVLIAQNVITGITQVSTSTTSVLAVTSANVSAGIPVLIPLVNGYVSPTTYDGGGAYAIDTLTNPSQAETVSAVSGPNQIGLLAVFTKTHAFGASVVYVPGSGSGAFTLANGVATNISAYNDVANMYTIESSGNNQALQFCTPAGTGSPTPLCANASNPSLCAGGTLAGCPGPDHWQIQDGEFRLQAGNQNALSVIVTSGSSETASAQLAAHNHFRKDWIHCDWYSLAVGSNACVDGIILGGVMSSIGDSYISGFLHPGVESHGIGHGQGGHGIKIYHNWIESASSGSFCGGAGSAGYSIPGIVPCNDVEWRRNRFTMPFSWLGIKPVPANPFWPNNFSLFRKNVFEVKEQNRTVLSGNIFENADTSGGQQGPGLVFDGSNASNGQGSNYQSINTNYYVSNNLLRNLCVNMLIGAGAKGGQGGVAFGGGYSSFPNNLWYNVATTSPGCAAALKYGFNFGSYPAIWGTGTSGTMTRDATGTIATFVAGCSANPAGLSDCPAGTGGLPYTGAGMAQSDINVGDSIGVKGCTGDTSFNTPFGVIFGSYSDLLLGTVAATGTTSNALTIVYANSGTPNSSDTSGNCRLYKRLGWTTSSAMIHNTSISNKTSAIAGQDSQADGANFARNMLFRDSIFVSGGGWTNTAVAATEGTPSENFNFDKTTLGNGYTVWPARTASLYTEYNNNPNYPLSGCNGAGCSPPLTMYFPTTSCLGWVTSCSSAIALTLPDYHGYALTAGSTFATGGATPASDGTSMGANIPAIDAATTANVFTCPYSCGSPGPYPDTLPTGTVPTITSANSAAFTVSTLGTFTVTTTGSPAPALSESGALPFNVTFTDNGNGTATLSGIPGATTGGAYPILITAANGNVPNATQTFTLTINQPPAFTSASSAIFTDNVPGTFTITATGYPPPVITLHTGTPPLGLMFTPGTGAASIGGTPSISGVTSLTFAATGSGTPATQPFTLTVLPPVTSKVFWPFTLNAVQPPTTPSDTNYAAYQALLSSANPLFTGGTVIIGGGCSSACGQLTYIDSGAAFPVLSFTTTDAVVATYTAVGKRANIIAAASTEGGTNNSTSSYVYTQNWANLLDTDGSGLYRGPVWTNGNVTRIGQYILAGGHYWQMTGTAAQPGNTTYGIGCQMASPEPAFVHGSGPYTETGAWPCTWSESTLSSGTAAPPQDALCTTDFAGTNCYSIKITNAVSTGGTATLTVATPPTFPNGQNIKVAGITTAGYTGLNNTSTGWTVSGSTSTTVSFAFTPTLASSPINTGATVSGTHLININTPNATLAMVASALPIAYELPYSTWRQFICNQTISHYNAGQLNGGYIVCGYEGGGEYSTFGVATQPFYGSAAQFRAIWLSGIGDFLVSQAGIPPRMQLYGDMNAVGNPPDYTYTDQECLLETRNNVMCRTNGFQVNDINNIVCSQGISSAYCSSITVQNACDNPPTSATLGCTSGGWYRNLYTYPTLANGTPNTGSLQTLTGSTLNCAATLTGPLSALAIGTPNCTTGFPGLFPSLVALRTTGLVTSPAPIKITIGNFEIYTSGPSTCTTNCTTFGQSAYPLGDILVGLDLKYSSTTYAQSPAVLFQLPYASVFAQYLSYGGQTGPATTGQFFTIGVNP